MARQARVVDVSCRLDHEGIWRFRGSYTPYFNRRIIHVRQVVRQGVGEWTVTDKVTGAAELGIDGALHFHPSVDVEVNGTRLICRRGDERLVVEGSNLGPWQVSRGQREPISGWFFPAFGVAEPCTTVNYRLQAAEGGGGLFLRIL